MKKQSLATNFATKFSMEQLENEKFPYRECTLFDHNGNPEKRWTIEFYVWNTSVQKLQRKRYEGEINREPDPNIRRKKAYQIITDIDRMLKSGYVISEATEQIPETLSLENIQNEINFETSTFIEAVDFYMDIKSSSIRETSYGEYKTLKVYIDDFLKKYNSENILLKNVTYTIANKFLSEIKADRKIRNKTYNNYRGNFSAIFNYYVKREIIPKNPCLRIEKLLVEKGGKHIPFNESQLQLISNKVLELKDKQFYLFINFCYYTLGRPGEEIRKLKIKHIRGNTILFNAHDSKNRKGEHVIIPPAFEEIIKAFNLRSYPLDYYIFGSTGMPAPEHRGINHFYKKQIKILKLTGLHSTDEFDLYSYKHSGVCALYKAGADIKAIQRQCRHSDILQTDIYLRDLGLIRNEEVVDKFPSFSNDNKKALTMGFFD